jgi:hypothetical protein
MGLKSPKLSGDADSCMFFDRSDSTVKIKKLPTSFSTVTDSLVLASHQYTITGSSSGTIVWSMPFQGSSYKKGVVYFNTMNDAGTSITYPTAFTKIPFVYGASSCTAVVTTSTTTLTISATSGVSGFLFIEGY